MSTPVARPARFRPSARRLPKPVAVAIAVAFALLTTVAVARVTFAASDPVDTTSWYTLTSRKSGLVLQAQGTAAGSGLTQAAATGATSQQFRFATGSGGTYRLVNRASGLAVTVPSGSTVTQAADTGATNQLWKTVVQSDYVRLATTSGTVLQITGASTKAGAAIQTGTDGKSYHQQWEITRVGAATGGTTPSATPSASATPKPSASATASATPKPTATATPAPSTGAFAKWPTATGEQKVTATIKISGTRDLGMVRYYGLSSGDQSESQPPMFQLEDGAVLKNVILGEGAADGVHCLGTCTLENVWWENVGEDAATFKGTSASQTMTVNGGGARSASDKTFQHNGPGTFVIKNFQLQDFGKLYRSCGNCSKQYARTVKVENVLITAPGKSLVGINSNLGDKATLSGVTIVGDSSKKIAICEEYKGVTSGEPSKVSSGPSAACGYTASSITYK
ncbi:pectate lyase [Cellulomonas sp. SLBN-39]|uniref:pectate lyase n=1 Tax=Cellulomonas sp. SLBN-39 TaxID=2768446 RepID=UPI00114E45B7|nr:pectate lyase [Cellulomonas sp. SLBN-39]TQL01033.1 ricin-type beta-trefoil lectin protein [Cellulomonas sp. SLBN-39]